MRYVALGDSYTIGTSVAEDERWPNQLADRIDEIELVANLGVALRLLQLKAVRVANFLPALVLAPIFMRVAEAVRQLLG